MRVYLGLHALPDPGLGHELVDRPLLRAGQAQTGELVPVGQVVLPGLDQLLVVHGAVGCGHLGKCGRQVT